MTKNFSIPIIYIVFNRPNFTNITFNIIKKIRPDNLYIIADGPRKNVASDIERCKATRHIVKDINWQCDAHFDFCDENIGCKQRVSGGITKAFNIFDHAIILEDDCLPDLSFFGYCKELLYKYKSNNKIMHISGCHFHKKTTFGNSSYYFSKFAHVWGWATWKQAWKSYDPCIKDWPDLKNSSVFNELMLNPIEKKRLFLSFENVYNGKLDTWDFQWTYNIIKNKGVCINPNVNLISNIGFHKGSTHTTDIASPFYKIKTYKTVIPLTHPKKINISQEADVLTAKLHFSEGKRLSFFDKVKRSTIKRIRNLSALITKKYEL